MRRPRSLALHHDDLMDIEVLATDCISEYLFEGERLEILYNHSVM